MGYIPIVKVWFILAWGEKTLYFYIYVKKFLVISLAVVYLAISSGVVVNIHYCMGKVAEVALGHSTSDKCGQCGMENDGCCHDDIKVVKIQDTHSVSSFHADFVKAHAIAQVYPDFIHSAEIFTLLTPIEASNAPPGKGQVPLTIQYCVFRI